MGLLETDAVALRGQPLTFIFWPAYTGRDIVSVSLKRTCQKTVGLGRLPRYLAERRKFSFETLTLAIASAQILRKRLCLIFTLRSNVVQRLCCCSRAMACCCFRKALRKASFPKCPTPPMSNIWRPQTEFGIFYQNKRMRDQRTQRYSVTNRSSVHP